MKRTLLTLAVAGLVLAPLSAQKYEPNWKSLDSRPTPEWYLDAKFGIFIHWGVYAVPAYAYPDSYSEWYWRNMTLDPKANERNQRNQRATRAFHARVYGKDFEYKQFAPMFRAELYDPDEWAELFKRSGAQYVVPTSKHHDGFALWPSEHANKTWGRPWNAASIGPKRDVLGDLADAVRGKGLKFGFYYSLYEWFNPLWVSDRERFVDEHMIPQFKDVVTRYKPALIFSDGEWDMPAEDWKSEEVLAWLYNESPSKDVVVANDRWGKGARHHHGDYFTTEYGAGMPDASHPWEENRGMGFSYAFNRNEPLENYRTGKELVWMLADLVSRGGNLLLNVGPTADGRIPAIQQDRLLALGAWLDVNGEAIYGTRTWRKPFQWSDGKPPEQAFGEYRVKYDILTMAGQGPRDGVAVKQVFFTKKGDTLYAITPGWPGDELRIKGLRAGRERAQVSLLGYDGALDHEQQGSDLVIRTPDVAPGDLPVEHAYSFKIEGAR